MSEANDNPQAQRQASNSALQTCSPFDAAKLNRLISIEGWLRFSLFMLFIIVFVGASQLESMLGSLSGLIVVATLGGWILIAMSGARVTQQLQRITALIDSVPEVAEDELAKAMRRFPLPKNLRLLLMHRLAALRHRQRRFPEAAAICQELLMHDVSMLRPMRAHMLLMFAESSLQAGHATLAWPALAQLASMPLRMVESLQYIALSTQYEILTDQTSSALNQLPSKLQMIELLPAEQCGALHLLFAEAAKQRGETSLAAWLSDRAALLLGDEDDAETVTRSVVSSISESQGLGGETSLA